MRSRARWLGVLLLVAAAACAQGSSPAATQEPPPPPPVTPPAPPPAPSSLAATNAGSFDVATLAWSGTCGGGWELQGEVVGNDWAPLHDGLIPVRYTAATLTFDPATPERLDLAFRIRCVVAGVASGWTAAPYRRGVREGELGPVTLAVPPSQPRTALVVAPTSRSAVATEVRVDRRERTAVGALGDWTEVATVGVGVPFVDPDLHAGSSYEYLVRFGVDSEWSLGAGGPPTEVPLQPPADVAIAVVPEGVRVSWTHPGPPPTGFDVVEELAWYPWEARIASVAADARAYVIAGSPPWPTSRYRVQAYLAPTGDRAAGEVVAAAPGLEVGPFALAGDLTTLGVAATDVPAGRVVARDASGRFHVLEQHFTNEVTWILHRPVAAGWDDHPLGSGGIIDPGLRVDAAGHPHVILQRSGAWEHDWHDGSSWRAEPVPLPPPADLLSASFDVAADGTVQVGAVIHALENPVPWVWTMVATRGAGGWTTEHLPFDGYTIEHVQTGVGPDGTVYLAGVGFVGGDSTSTPRATLVEGLPGGAWTLRRVAESDGAGALVLMPAVSGRAAVAWWSISGGPVTFEQRSGDGFGAPEDTGATVPVAGPLPATMRGDGTGARLATTSGGGIVLVGRGDAGWSSMRLVDPGELSDGLWIGYAPDGRFWALARPYAPPDATIVPEVLYLEP